MTIPFATLEKIDIFKWALNHLQILRLIFRDRGDNSCFESCWEGALTQALIYYGIKRYRELIAACLDRFDRQLSWKWGFWRVQFEKAVCMGLYFSSGQDVM